MYIVYTIYNIIQRNGKKVIPRDDIKARNITVCYYYPWAKTHNKKEKKERYRE